jgi:hypothetical protein
MISKNQRRARKRAISLAGGQSVSHRPSGRDRTHTNQPPEDARMTALAARERHTGLTGKDALDPAQETDLGRCIVHLTHGDERAQLLDAWGEISAAHRNYRMIYVGQTGNPQGAAIGFIPDRLETDPSLRVDMRTHDERVAAAKSAWAAWDARMKAMTFPQMIWALRGALDGFMGDASLWRDRSPTSLGKLAVEALRQLHTTP